MNGLLNRSGLYAVNFWWKVSQGKGLEKLSSDLQPVFFFFFAILCRDWSPKHCCGRKKVREPIEKTSGSLVLDMFRWCARLCQEMIGSPSTSITHNNQILQQWRSAWYCDTNIATWYCETWYCDGSGRLFEEILCRLQSNLYQDDAMVRLNQLGWASRLTLCSGLGFRLCPSAPEASRTSSSPASRMRSRSINPTHQLVWESRRKKNPLRALLCKARGHQDQRTKPVRNHSNETSSSSVDVVFIVKSRLPPRVQSLLRVLPLQDTTHWSCQQKWALDWEYQSLDLRFSSFSSQHYRQVNAQVSEVALAALSVMKIESTGRHGNFA